jgi:hypothetical protein
MREQPKFRWTKLMRINVQYILTDFSEVFEYIENGLSDVDVSIFGVCLVPVGEHTQHENDASMAHSTSSIAFCKHIYSLAFKVRKY